MKQKRSILILVLLIVLLSSITASFGILSHKGDGPYQYESIRGESVEIYGRGVYHHMSADVAVQGIAQDYVTLFAGIPLLLISLIGCRRNSIRYHFLLAGTLLYFFVTYLFYTAMGMYNVLFLFYTALLGLSFFGLILAIYSFDLKEITEQLSIKIPNKLVGGFLIFNSIAIAILWLGIIIPPLFDGSIYPVELQHYTTLIVQGFDLGLLLPASFVAGLLLFRARTTGFLFGTIYIVFLSILMTALSAKIIAMYLNDVNVIPAVFIIPGINIFTIICAFLMIRSFQTNRRNESNR
jgi:hypothetical protein